MVTWAGLLGGGEAGLDDSSLWVFSYPVNSSLEMAILRLALHFVN